MREATASGAELTAANCAISVVSADSSFEIIEDAGIQPYIDQIDVETEPAAEAGGGGAAAMDTAA